MEGYHTYQLFDVATRYALKEHELFRLLDHFAESDDYWIAGGAVRAFMLNEPIKTDVDFFFKSPQAYDQFLTRFAKDLSKTSTPHQSTFNVMVKDRVYKIQAIRIRYYDSIEQCLDSFDFSICQLAAHKGKLYAGQYTLWDLARRRLALHKLTYGAATVGRLLKYTSQGFTACSSCIVSLLRAVGENPSVINSEIQYVD